jgi:phosphate transport system substrate-binding protein
MSRKLNVFVFMCVVAAMILAACAPAATPTPQVVESTKLVEVTKIVAGTPMKETVVVQATTAPQPTKLAPGSVQINGSGATFPQPVYTEWIYAYQYVDPSVTINYQGVGSGGGKKAIVDGTVDFAGSDSLLVDDDYKNGKDLQMYPVLAGATVLIYNVEGLKDTDPALILDGKTLVGIYNGTIKNWNDDAIKKLNPDLASKLPAKPITTVHRSDGSGTTEMFTRALTAFSPDWKAGAAQSVEWPVDKAGGPGNGGKGSQGVAAAVQNTPNSIGYIELSYAVANKIAYASMVNKAGKTVKADGTSISSAMADFADKFDDKLTAVIVDGAGEKSWPITGYTYLILHTTNMQDCTKAQKILEYIKWSLTDTSAAKRAVDLGFNVLPAATQKTVLAKLAAVTCKGQPVLK